MQQIPNSHVINVMKPTTKLTLRFFWKHAKRYKWRLAAIFSFLTLGIIGNMGWILVFRNFFDTLTSGESHRIIVAGLLSSLTWLAIVEVCDVFGWRGSQFLNSHFQPKVMANISEECFEYMHKHSYRFFSNNFSGGLVKKINRLARGFEDISDKIMWDMYPLVMKVITILVILFITNVTLGTIMLIWTTVFIAANYALSRFKWKYDIDRSEADTRITASLADTITNANNLKFFASLKYEIGKFQEVTHDWFKKTRKSWRIATYIEFGQAIFMVILELIILYVAIHLWDQNLIKIADFYLIQAYLFEMFHQLWMFGRNLRNIYERLAESEEMIAILNQPWEIKDKKGAKKLKLTRGEVEFNKVQFAYGKKDKIVLEKLSFKVRPGEKIALIGPSGGGKSTITKLILRLFDLKSGKILIDKQDIASVTQDSLRQQIALVPQDPILFHRSLMDNIRYGRIEASDEEVLAAAKMANCHDFIMKFPKQYETFVGERGIKLSGGQRQRVAIARAILTNAKILVLDEATSSLDSESEMLIQDALTKLIKQKTTFIIAHRLSTIMSVDRIFVLDQGQIVEEGRHADLISKKSGLYKKLWELQVGGYLA